MNHLDSEKRFVFLHRELQYALPVSNVLEIVETPALLPSHASIPSCLGNVSHRGQLMPILDPTALGTGRGSASSVSNTFIVVADSGVHFGLAMDRFVAVVPLDGVGPDDAHRGHDNPHVLSVRAFRKNALILLSPSSVAALMRRDFGNQFEISEHDRDLGPRRATSRGEMPQRVYLCARIEHVRFGIPIDQIIEVIEGYDVTSLYKMPPILRGLLNLRGQVLACVDISTELGFPPRTLEERNQFVVLQGDGAVLALCIDRVNGIRRVNPEAVQNADTVLTGGMTRYAEGVVEQEDGTLFLLSVPAVFDSPQLQRCRRQEP
jgi:purine-binding chemotaxis protein CheW